jgi:uncharacterized protein (DUF697 family)
MVSPLVLKRPILVGGLGLTASLWLLNTLQHSFDGSLMTSALVVGTGVWWWRQRQPQPKLTAPQSTAIAPVERTAVVQALADLLPLIEQLATEGNAAPQSAPWQARVATLGQRRLDLVADLDRQILRFAIVGAPSTGKTILLQQLAEMATDADRSPVMLEVGRSAQTGSETSGTWAEAIADQDVVIYLVTEDLTASVQVDLATLTEAGHTVALVLNKQDHYPPEARTAVVANLRNHAQALSSSVTIGAIAAAPNPVKVRTHQADGTVSERWETPAPDLAALQPVLRQWSQDAAHLVTQTVQRQGQQLRRDIQQGLNQLRRDRARPLVEQLQWTAAATALASPLPSLDLIAAVAINGQLVMDLGQVYDQPLTLGQAKAAASELAGLVVKLGLVEASTQILTTALKSHAATYLVGGAVQGLSAAYLTHLVGTSLMDCLEARALQGDTATPLSASTLAQTVQTLMQRTQQATFVKGLVQQGLQHFQATVTGPQPALALADGEALPPATRDTP